jgi:hypothetical protein
MVGAVPFSVTSTLDMIGSYCRASICMMYDNERNPGYLEEEGDSEAEAER